MRHVPTVGIAILALAAAAPARAESSSEVQAQVLFDEAKHLRDAGHLAEACTKFSQSQALSAGVGITLHLADCYERLGKTASAWQEFRLAEKTAREQNDAKRAELAHNRAEAIAPTLTRLVVEVPQDAAAAGGSVQVDGAAIPAEAWNKPLAVDPGDHVIAFAIPGQEPRTKTAYLGASAPLRTVHFDVAAAATAAAAATPAPVPAPAPAAPEPAAPPPDTGAGRRWAEYGLGLAGLVGVGVGAALLAADSQSPSTTSSGCGTPPPDSGLMTGAIIAFGAGGAALASALVLYLTGPHSAPAKESALVVAPAALPGGGGAFLRTAF